MNLLRRTASLPGLRSVLLRPGIRRRVAGVLALRFLVAAFATSTPLSVLAGEVARRGEVGVYRLRSSGRTVALQHGRDMEPLFELFVRGEYEPPQALVPRLDPDRIREVLDVGANVGMFAAWALGRWPRSRVTCVEPSPQNLTVLRRVVGTESGRLELVEAAVGTEAGEAGFVDGWGGGSHLSTQAEDGEVTTVPVVDYLPLFARADFVKMDIEGAEWPILADDRLAEVGPTVLVLEYHRVGAPFLPAVDAAYELLTGAGFQVEHGHANYWGHGTLWAWKD
ncbi:MAG TPA: FkbM family methyltransferase [Phycicoccus sp.]|nr:FkbM family methyltransferase [Phycicoccus sp.]